MSETFADWVTIGISQEPGAFLPVYHGFFGNPKYIVLSPINPTRAL